MRNFILGFISALFLVGVSYGIYNFVISSKKDEVSRESQGNCAHLKSGSTDFGKAEITITSNSGQSVKEVEVNLGDLPGAEVYCWTKTDDNGVASFDDVPAGGYYIYFNDVTLPPALGGGDATPVLQIEVSEGATAEAGIELK